MELRYQVENPELYFKAQVFKTDDPDKPWLLKFFDTICDGPPIERFFEHYDDAEAHADSFCLRRNK